MPSERKTNAQKKEEFRKVIADKFLNILERDRETESYEWVKEWKSISHTQHSLTSKSVYRGMNALILTLTAIENGYKDPRWITFKGCKKFKEAGVNQGEKGTKIQFKNAYDLETKKYISMTEAFELVRNDERDWMENLFPNIQTYTVFNAEQCHGLPELEIVENNIKQDEFVTTVARNLGVEILNDSDSAFYRPSEDKVHLPDPSTFTSEYAYNSTALHELGHSTGNEMRLNRDIQNSFGDEKYAFEELVAELTSCMTSVDFALDDASEQEYIENHSKNHLAYLQGWTEFIKKDPKLLEEAYMLAEQATDYIDLAGGKITLEQFRKLQPNIEVDLAESGEILFTLNKKSENQNHVKRELVTTNTNDWKLDYEIRWSENPIIHRYSLEANNDIEKLTFAELDTLMEKIDADNKKDDYGYDKAPYKVTLSKEGQEEPYTYEGRVDLGDGFGGITGCIRQSLDYEITHNTSSKELAQQFKNEFLPILEENVANISDAEKQHVDELYNEFTERRFEQKIAMIDDHLFGNDSWSLNDRIYDFYRDGRMSESVFDEIKGDWEEYKPKIIDDMCNAFRENNRDEILDTKPMELPLFLDNNVDEYAYSIANVLGMDDIENEYSNDLEEEIN